MYVDEDADTVTDTSTNMNSNTNTNAKSIRSLATNDIIVPTLPEIVGGQSTLLLNNDNVSLMDISYGSMNGEEPSLFIDPNFDSNETPTCTSTNSSQNVSKKSTYTRAKDVPTNGGKISNLNQLVDSFKLPKTIKTSLPTELERKTEANITETNQRGGLGMLNLLQMCTNQMIDIVCPGPSRNHLRHSLAQRLIDENLQAAQRKRRTKHEQFDHLLSCIFNIMNASKKGSIPKRISRAILCAGIPRVVTLRDACNLFKTSTISTGTTRMNALVDYELLDSGKFSDERKIKNRNRKSNDTIGDAVKFILHQDNVKMFSWGSVVKQLSENETIILPKLQHITTRTN